MALHKKLLGHSTYLMARRAGSLVEPGHQGGHAATTAAMDAAAAAVGGSRGLQRTRLQPPQQQQQQQQQQQGLLQQQLTAATAAAMAVAAAEGFIDSKDPHEDELAAIKAAWSTRRRATPFHDASKVSRFQGNSDAAGGWRSLCPCK
jgi:hypothetical protein